MVKRVETTYMAVTAASSLCKGCSQPRFTARGSAPQGSQKALIIGAIPRTQISVLGKFPHGTIFLLGETMQPNGFPSPPISCSLLKQLGISLSKTK